MSHLVELKCPSCMGRLEVAETADRVVCGFCGNAHLLMISRTSATAAPAPVIDNTLTRAMRNINAEIASRIRALKACESERLTTLGYGVMIFICAVISLGISAMLLSTHEWAALFVPLFLFGCILFWVGVSRVREHIEPTAEEVYLRDTLVELQSRLQQLTDEVKQGKVAETSVAPKS